MPRRRLRSRFSLLTTLGLAAGIALAGWAYWTYYHPFANWEEKTLLVPENVTGFRTTDKLVLTINLSNPSATALRGNLRLELRDPQGNVLAERDKAINQTAPAASYRLELPAPTLAADKITLRCFFRNQKLFLPLGRVLTIKGHEVTLTASRELYAGSQAALRCGVHRVQSIWETLPVAGVRVQIDLHSPDGTVFPLHEGRTTDQGWDNAAFQVPAIAPGPYTLQVVTRSELGEDRVERPVQIKMGARVLLTTDKPLYQPGEVIHVKAFAFRLSDLKPLAGFTAAFEIEDDKGNKILQRSQPLAGNGGATVDCPLSSSATSGAYRVRVVLGTQRTEKVVSVQRVLTPKLLVDLKTDKPFYRPRDILHATIQVEHTPGKPVAGVALELSAETFDGQSHPLPNWKGKTAADGQAQLDLPIPDNFARESLRKGAARLQLNVRASAPTGQVELVSRSLPVSDRPIRVCLIPEGGRLVSDMENRVFAVAIDPVGRPAPCALIIYRGKETKGPVAASVEIRESGLAEFRFVPQGRYFRTDPRKPRTGESRDPQPRGAEASPRWFDLTVEVRDRAGASAATPLELPVAPAGHNVLLWPDKAIYQAGETMRLDLKVSSDIPFLYLDLVQHGQTVLTDWLRVDSGNAEAAIALPAALFGPLEIHAYHLSHMRETIHDSRVVYVQPPNTWKIESASDAVIHPDKEFGQIQFLPLEKERPSGGILLEDNAYALPEPWAGLAPFFPTLLEELFDPRTRTAANPVATLAPFFRDPDVMARRQRAARAMLTVAVPRLPTNWVAEPGVDRKRQYYEGVRQIGQAVFRHALAGKPFMQYDRQSRHWIFRPNLLQELVAARLLDAAALTGPFGDKLLLDDLKTENGITPGRLAEMVTWSRFEQLIAAVAKYSDAHRAEFLQDGKWLFPATILTDAVAHGHLDAAVLKDAWGEPIRLVRRPDKRDNKTGWTQFDSHELVSAGPDRLFGTLDDLKYFDPQLRRRVAEPWFELGVMSDADRHSGDKANPAAAKSPRD